MIRQILAESKITPDEGWDDVILSMAVQIGSNVNPDVKNGDDPDVREYVKVKRIPGGSPQDSEYVSGIVISKSVTHKSMVRRIQDPKILLIDFSLEYERVANQFVSLDRVLAQEHEHLRNLVARITATKPDIVVVSGNVSRLAAEFLREAGIVVASNVRLDVLEMIARFTRADIVHSIDRLALNFYFGTCAAFDVRFYTDSKYERGRKSFLWFEGCPSHLGATVVLRGGDAERLTRIKQAMTLMTLVVHSLKLETSLIMDQVATISVADIQQLTRESVLRVSDADSLVVARYLQYQEAVLSSSPYVSIAPPLTVEASHKAAIGRVSAEVGHDGELEDRGSRFDSGGLALDGDTLSPFGHQSITLLSYFICEGNAIPCQPPELIDVDYYGLSDSTLGQLVEYLCSRATVNCSARGCDRPKLLHTRVYVHRRGQVSVAVEKRPCPIRGLDTSMVMWSKCKVCQSVTPFTALGEDSWSFSVAKYLELAFYLSEVKSRAKTCAHDMQRDHVRYIGYRNLAVKFDFSPIRTFSLFPPPLRVAFSDEVRMRLKTQDLAHLKSLSAKFFDTMAERLRTVTVTEATVGLPRLQTCKDEIAELQRKIGLEKNQLMDQLQQLFATSADGDALVLSSVYRSFVDRHREWESEFAAFGKWYFQADARRITGANQIRKVFTEEKERSTETSDARAEGPSSAAPDRMPGVDTSPDSERFEQLELLSDRSLVGTPKADDDARSTDSISSVGFSLSSEQSIAHRLDFGKSADRQASQDAGEPSTSTPVTPTSETLPGIEEDTLAHDRNPSTELNNIRDGVNASEDAELRTQGPAEKSSLIKAMTALWNGNSVNWSPLESVV
jgi:1-phosphatidylinositol-3-phosphate 5-kinase